MEANVYNNYLHYFLNAFANNEKIYAKIKFEDSVACNYIATIASNFKNRQGSELSIKIDKESFSFFGDFIPDEYVDYFDCSETEIFEILDKYIVKFKYILENGYKVKCYKNDIKGLTAHLVVDDSEEIKNTDRLKEIIKQEYNFCEEIDKIIVYDFYGELIGEYDLKIEKTNSKF